MGVDATGMKTRMRLREPSGGGVCRAEHNGRTVKSCGREKDCLLTDTMKGQVDASAVQSSDRMHLRRRWIMASPQTLQERALDQACKIVLFVALELSDK